MLKLKNTIVVAVLLMLSSGCKKEKSRICELYSSEVAYSVGTIESFVSVPFRVTYSYSFVANGQTFEGNEKAYGVGQKK